MKQPFERYSEILNNIDNMEDGVSVEGLSKKLGTDKNSLLLVLYEMKSMGWLHTKDIEKWKITDFGLQAKNLLLKEIERRNIEITPEKVNLLITFPREFGNLANYFPQFLDISHVFKNEIADMTLGDEILLLTYAIDFKILSQILEDPTIIPAGKEKDFICRIQYFNGYNETEISNLIRSGFNIQANKISLSGPGNPHAKIIIFKKSKSKSAIISSANFTDNVFATRNLELGILIKEKYLVEDLENFFSWLWKRTHFE